jgi:hypothetical protein
MAVKLALLHNHKSRFFVYFLKFWFLHYCQQIFFASLANFPIFLNNFRANQIEFLCNYLLKYFPISNFVEMSETEIVAKVEELKLDGEKQVRWFEMVEVT